MTPARRTILRVSLSITALFGVMLTSLGLFLLSSFADAQSGPTKTNVVRCFVSILPQEFFVSRIGGSHVTTDVLVGPGQEPHTFELTPRAMTSLAQADLFFSIGLPFEQVIIKKLARMPHKVRIIDTTTGVPFLKLQSDHEHHHHDTESHADTKHEHAGKARETNPEEKSDHSHDNNGQHASGSDPHVWLDPKLVKLQATNISQALIAADPGHADYYKDNLTKFERELDDLDATLAAALAPYKGQKFFVYHPAFGYFAARYGLVQVPVEVEGKEPTAKHIADLVKSAKENGIRIIFVEPQFSRKSAEIIAKAIGGSVVVVDPLNRDYINGMRAIGSTITKSMQSTLNNSGK